jgi:hypothetical protein
MSEPLCQRDLRPVCLLGDDLTQHSEMDRTLFLLEYIQNIELRKRIQDGLKQVSGKISTNGDTSEVHQVVQLKEPEPRGLVIAAGDEPAVIRADRHRLDRVLVGAQNHGVSSRIFCAQIPEPRCLVRAAGDNPAVIRAAADKIASNGEWSETVEPPNGKPFQLKGYWLAIETSEGDAWKICMSAYNLAFVPPK